MARGDRLAAFSRVSRNVFWGELVLVMISQIAASPGTRLAAGAAKFRTEHVLVDVGIHHYEHNDVLVYEPAGKRSHSA